MAKVSAVTVKTVSPVRNARFLRFETPREKAVDSELMKLISSPWTSPPAERKRRRTTSKRPYERARTMTDMRIIVKAMTMMKGESDMRKAGWKMFRKNVATMNSRVVPVRRATMLLLPITRRSRNTAAGTARAISRITENTASRPSLRIRGKPFTMMPHASRDLPTASCHSIASIAASASAILSPARSTDSRSAREEMPKLW